MRKTNSHYSLRVIFPYQHVTSRLHRLLQKPSLSDMLVQSLWEEIWPSTCHCQLA